jgi:4-carboxymuconolactone decarboxylase
MKLLVASVVALVLIAPAWAQVNQPAADRGSTSMPAPDDLRSVAPALDKYRQDRLLGDVWKRPGLTPRDRSIVTVAALVARHQTTELPYHLDVALDHGVKPREISEIITHLAFYSGWGNAMSAVGVAREVFARRRVGPEQLPPASPPLLPLNEVAEADRHVGQIPYHLNRAMDVGLTQAQAAEVITHLAFYAGWPNAFSALPVAKDVFDKRPK